MAADHYRSIKGKINTQWQHKHVGFSPIKRSPASCSASPSVTQDASKTVPLAAGIDGLHWNETAIISVNLTLFCYCIC